MSVKSAVHIIELAVGDNERVWSKAFELWKNRHDLDPAQCANLAFQQIEEERQTGVREGRIYDCPQKQYATRVVRDGKSYCGGFVSSVLSREVAADCLSCQCYSPSCDGKLPQMV
jgi:hypothetical protein